SVTALAICLPLGLFDFLTLRRGMVRDVTTLADVLARNSTAALSFGDTKAAAEVLQAAQAETSVTAACIYTSDGTLFARYVRDSGGFASMPPMAATPLTQV